MNPTGKKGELKNKQKEKQVKKRTLSKSSRGYQERTKDQRVTAKMV